VVSISFIGAAAIILGVIFSLFLSHLISRPVTELTKAVAQIAEGNYDVQVEASGSGELTALAEHFNLMAEKLRQYREMNIGRLIAEKNKSEAIIQSVDDGIVVLDDKLLVSDLNPKGAEILRVSHDESLGRHIFELIRDERLLGFLKLTLESGKPAKLPAGEDIITVKTDGVSGHYQCSIMPMQAPSAPVQGVILVLRDVTRLKELDRLKSEFVMTASHELRTPLTSIAMAVDMLREQAAAKLTDKERQFLDVCHEDVQRLQALVNDLLDLAKIEAGKVELAFEPSRPRFLCEQAVSVIKPQADAKNLEISLKVADDLPEVMADPNKIVWVLVNLLANSVRYTPAGGHLRISGERLGGQVHLAVSDDGDGVPYELQPRIFDKFVQAKRGQETGGSGLGLAICKEIVRAHRGAIWLDSIPGLGSTFTFTLPVAEP
jgi:two-component system, NtrC family, sensor histidine kinase KinB